MWRKMNYPTIPPAQLTEPPSHISMSCDCALARAIIYLGRAAQRDRRSGRGCTRHGRPN